MAENAFIPVHVAVIMDGNGRWAAQRKLPRFTGHYRGAERVKEIVRAARDEGVKVLTLFAFSTENWSRPQAEVKMLMRYFHDFLHREQRDMLKNGIRLRVVGRRETLPERLRNKIISIEHLTAHNSVLTLVIAIDYGARQEILEAVTQTVKEARRREGVLEAITEEGFSRHLYTHGLPDPDLLIRTSGEQRLSNFMLWQCSYAELYFAKKFWPDFGKEDFKKALAEFKKRKRRFGAV